MCNILKTESFWRDHQQGISAITCFQNGVAALRSCRYAWGKKRQALLAWNPVKFVYLHWRLQKSIGQHRFLLRCPCWSYLEYTLLFLVCLMSFIFPVRFRQPARRWNKPEIWTSKNWCSTQTASSLLTVYFTCHYSSYRCYKKTFFFFLFYIFSVFRVTWMFLLHKGITSWVKNWKTNGWRLKTGGHVVNKEDFQKLDELNEELDVKWVRFRLP